MTNLKRAEDVARTVVFMKALTGYDKLGSSRLTPGHVLLNWPTAVPALSALQTWRCDYTSKAPNLCPGETRCQIKWIFDRAGERITVKTLVFIDGPEAAQNVMFYSAADTSMHSPPYVRGPEIGDCCIISRNTGNLRWCHGNTLCSIDSWNKSEVVLAVARELDALMTTHAAASIGGSKPKIDTIRVFPKKASVGGKITIDIRLIPTTKAGDEIFEANCDTDYLSYESMDELANIEFTVIKSGRTEIQVLIADAETLIATRVTIPIEIQ